MTTPAGHYQQGMPMDANYIPQGQNQGHSPSSSRRSRKGTGNGNTASPGQLQQYSPSSGVSYPPITRQHQSDHSEGRSSMDYNRALPPVAPPRTSSNQRQSSAAPTSSSGRRREGSQTQTDERVRTATGDNAEAYRQTNGYREKSGSGDAAANRSSRRSQQPEATSHRSQRNQSQRVDDNGIGETTDIISRLVVSEPAVDIERERERMAEAVPHGGYVPAEAPAVPMGGHDGANGERRRQEETPVEHSPQGERRRQDHSASKREKNTRFGEYYLGNTLGEGEFGKVKMGWKQEGGVQVCFHDHWEWRQC